MTDLDLYPDVETLVVDVLKATLPEVDGAQDATVGVNVPTGWTSSETSPPRVQVRDDNPDASDMPVAGFSTISLIVRAFDVDTAKRVCARAQAVLCARHDLISATWLTGPQTARDPDTKSELATATVLVAARSTRPPA